MKKKRKKPMRCPYCGAPVVYRSADGIYQNNKNGVMLYVCSRYPECDAYVRVQPGTAIPLGTLANGELRALRRETHQYFDKLYTAATDKGGCFSTYAYRLIWNEICTALIPATRKASGEQPMELPILEIQGTNGEFTSALELEDLLERGESTAKGVAKKGIQALRLRLKGYSTREIGVRLGAPDNYITAWEAKARSYLRAMQ